MAKIESIKSYTGEDLDNIFFRPMLTGPSAEELGIRVMYNMPVPTVLHFWKRSGNILQKFTSAGWNGSAAADKFQKTIDLRRVKAEVGYSAEDYFSMVYELISSSPDVNMGDLSGTALETAETTLFKQAVAESIRTTMWLGNSERYGFMNTFDGFLKHLCTDTMAGEKEIVSLIIDRTGEKWATQLLAEMWNRSNSTLRALKSEGQLAYFVTSDIYAQYENELDQADYESAYIARQDGRQQLCYRGIPLVDVALSDYNNMCEDLPNYFALLTDRRNLALAVNTSDFPGTEVNMWYNPDEMENRQRAVFMAGCDYLLPELVTFAIGGELNTEVVISDNVALITIDCSDQNSIESVKMVTLSGNNITSELYQVEGSQLSGEHELQGTDVDGVRMVITYRNGIVETKNIR